MRYDSGDEWDDRLRHEQYGEDGYEEWTWDRCIPLTFRHAVSEIVGSQVTSSQAGCEILQGPVAPQIQQDVLSQKTMC